MRILKRIMLCVLATVMMLGGSLFAACGPESEVEDEFLGMYDLEGLVPTFRDEFNGNRLDPYKWQHEVRGNWYNNELQYYDENGVTVWGGMLTITARKDPKTFDSKGVETTDPDKISFSRDYGSSRIRTYEKFSQMYGRFEARIKLPAVRAMWPAFWMLSEENAYGNWPLSGEIDIMEGKGRLPDHMGAAVHYGNAGGSMYKSTRYYFPNEETIEEFHIYAVEWEMEKMTWYVDGIETFSVTIDQWFTGAVPASENPQAPFDKEFHMLLNLAVGGNYDKDNNVNVVPDEDFSEASMEVDWVRVWQFEKYMQSDSEDTE